MTHPTPRIASSSGLALLALLGIACATTRSAPPERLSGFLEDYSILEEGEGDAAALVYIKENAHLGSYRQVLLESVTLWYGVGTPLHDVPREELQILADRLYAAVYEKLEDDYEFVARPGPGVLRIRIALTEAEASNVVMDVISTAMPIRPVSGSTYLVTGVSSFVGTAGIEMELRDGLTDEVLVAVVDRRAGAKNLKGSTEKWDDVLQSFEYWADRIDTRLAEYRAQDR